MLSSIQGVVFNDPNANRVADIDESGLAGWTVYLDDNRNGILDLNQGEISTTSDANGHYFFDTTNKPSAQGCTIICDVVTMELPVSSGGRWLNTTGEFIAVRRSDEPVAVRDIGAYFQPYDGLAPIGGETLVNQKTAGQAGENEDGPAHVAADSAGNYAIVWRNSTGSGTDTISVRLFNADGTARKDEITVTSFPVVPETFALPAIAMAGNGKFIVAWNAWTLVKGQKVSSVEARTFAADGTPSGGVLTISAPKSSPVARAWLNGVATDSTGNFGIAYGYYNNSYAAQNFVQRYTAAGAANGKAIALAPTGGQASIVMDGAGNFVIAWDANSTVYAQRYTASGVKVGSQIVVTPSNARNSNVAMNGSGQFVVTWADNVTGLQTAKRYKADGTLLAGPVSFHASEVGSGFQTGVSLDSAGNAVFVWTDNRSYGAAGASPAYIASTPYWEVRLRRWTSSGLEPETIVNTTTAGGQYSSGIAATGSGVVVAWQGNGPGDDSGIFAQRFAPLSTATAPSSASATDTALVLLLMTEPSTTNTRK